MEGTRNHLETEKEVQEKEMQVLSLRRRTEGQAYGMTLEILQWGRCAV
jgi:hypothetical protein